MKHFGIFCTAALFGMLSPPGIAEDGLPPEIATAVSNVLKPTPDVRGLRLTPSIDAALNPGRDEEDKIETWLVEELHGKPEALRTAVLMSLLESREGKYVPLPLLECLVGGPEPGKPWSLENARAINEALCKHIGFWGEQLRKRGPDPQLQAYITVLTDQIHAHWFLRNQLDGNPEFAEEIGRDDPVMGIKLDRLAVFPLVTPPGNSVISPSGWVAAGDKLIARVSPEDNAEPAFLRLNLATGLFDRPAWDLRDKNSDGISCIAGDDGRVLLRSNDHLIALDTRSGKDRRRPLPHGGPYGTVCAGSAKMVFGWSAPPHYLGALEREPQLAKDPSHMASLGNAIHVWNCVTGQMDVTKAEAAIPFIGDTKTEIKELCVLPGDRLAVTFRERYPLSGEWPPKQTAYVSETGNLTQLTQWGELPGHWTIRPWNGRAGQILIISQSLLSSGVPLEEPQPERMLAYDCNTGQLRQLWSADSKLMRLQPWETKPFPQPAESTWQLSPGLCPPPAGEMIEWLKVTTQRGDIIALCARTHVGQQLFPQHELIVFREGLKHAVRIPVQFATTPELRTLLAALKRDGVQDPARLDQMAPILVPSSHHLAFVTWFGVWWMSWEEFDEAVKKLSARN